MKMGDRERGNIDMMMQSVQNPFSTPSNNNDIDVSQLNMTQVRTPLGSNSLNLSTDSNGKKTGIPPSHPSIPPISPHSQIPVTRQGSPQLGSQNHGRGSAHPRSLFQPSCNGCANLSENRSGNGNSLHMTNEGLPPRKVHRRSMSDVPFGFDSVMRSSTPCMVPPRSPGGGGGGLDRTLSGGELVKKEVGLDKLSDGNGESGEIVDDLVSAYMNLDNIDAMNSSDDKNGCDNRDDIECPANGSKINGHGSGQNEAESSMNDGIGSGCRGRGKRERVKRNAAGEVAPTFRHCPTCSMDSVVGKLNVGDESPELPPSPNENLNDFILDFDNGDFTEAELSQIMADEKLAEMASTDPKRVKRILANRASAARSKNRRLKYISELEHKVQTLQNEATTLSSRLTLLQRNSDGLTCQNNELKLRLQAMEQEAQLRNALNTALTTELQRLKTASGERTPDAKPKCFGQQLFINPQMFGPQQQSAQQDQCQSQQGGPDQEHSKPQDPNNDVMSKSEPEP